MASTLSKKDRLKQLLAGAKDVRPESVDQSGAIPEYATPEDKEYMHNIAKQEDVLRTEAILNEADQQPSPLIEEAPPPPPPSPPAPAEAPAEQTQAVKPPSIEEVVGNSGSKINNEIAVSEPGDNGIGDALKEYYKVVNIAMDEYRKEKKAIKQKELWDGIIKGVGLMAAGLYGLKTGSDMGGVKVNTIDWASNLRNAQSELQSALGQAGRSYNIKKGIGEAVERRNQQLWERGFKEAREKRLAEDSMFALAAKTAAARGKKEAASKKEDNKQATAEKKEISRLEKEINNRIDKFAKPNASDEEKELHIKQIEQLNEKYKNLTGKDMASTKKIPTWWGFSERTPAEMLDIDKGVNAQTEVKMIGPDGKTYTIPAVYVGKALQGGWKKAE